MTQAAHTPGPWVHDADCAGRILGPDGVVVCAVYGSMARAQEDDCNQRLIAAAPDMLDALVARALEDDCNQRLIAAAPDLLAALELLVFDCEAHGLDDNDAHLREAYAAIAKAKGN